MLSRNPACNILVPLAQFIYIISHSRLIVNKFNVIFLSSPPKIQRFRLIFFDNLPNFEMFSEKPPRSFMDFLKKS